MPLRRLAQFLSFIIAEHYPANTHNDPMQLSSRSTRTNQMRMDLRSVRHVPGSICQGCGRSVPMNTPPPPPPKSCPIRGHLPLQPILYQQFIYLTHAPISQQNPEKKGLPLHKKHHFLPCLGARMLKNTSILLPRPRIRAIELRASCELHHLPL